MLPSGVSFLCVIVQGEPTKSEIKSSDGFSTNKVSLCVSLPLHFVSALQAWRPYWLKAPATVAADGAVALMASTDALARFVTAA